MPYRKTRRQREEQNRIDDDNKENQKNDYNSDKNTTKSDKNITKSDRSGALHFDSSATSPLFSPSCFSHKSQNSSSLIAAQNTLPRKPNPRAVSSTHKQPRNNHETIIKQNNRPRSVSPRRKKTNTAYRHGRHEPKPLHQPRKARSNPAQQ